jgi:hypothetical protein
MIDLQVPSRGERPNAAYHFITRFHSGPDKAKKRREKRAVAQIIAPQEPRWAARADRRRHKSIKKKGL